MAVQVAAAAALLLLLGRYEQWSVINLHKRSHSHCLGFANWLFLRLPNVNVNHDILFVLDFRCDLPALDIPILLLIQVILFLLLHTNQCRARGSFFIASNSSAHPTRQGANRISMPGNLCRIIVTNAQRDTKVWANLAQRRAQFENKSWIPVYLLQEGLTHSTNGFRLLENTLTPSGQLPLCCFLIFAKLSDSCQPFHMWDMANDIPYFELLACQMSWQLIYLHLIWVRAARMCWIQQLVLYLHCN